MQRPCRVAAQLSAGKCKASANTASIGRNLVQKLGTFCVQFTAGFNSLGVGMACGARRNTQVQGSRLAAFRARLGKLALLARSRVSSARLLRTGGAASFTYGDDVTGVSADALLQRRRMVASAVAPPTGGRDLDLALLLADTDGHQRLDPAFDASTLPMSRWAEAVYSQWCPLPLLTASIARARLRILLAWRPWAVVCGPAAATVATAQRLGWEVRDAATFVTDQGRVLDLRADPPVVVRKEVQAAVGR